MHKFPVTWLVRVWTIVALLLLLSSPILAAPVTINNPSFEDGLNGWYSLDNSADAYMRRGTVASNALPEYPTYTSPDGDYVAWANHGGDIRQMLPTPIAANTAYTLTVYVGHPGYLPISPPPDPGYVPPDNPPIYYAVQFWSAGPSPALLASTPSSSYDPGIAQFGLLTLSYNSTQSDVNQYLTIVLKAFDNSAMVNFDKVTMDATTTVPEPVTMLLLGIGFIGLAGVRKRMDIRLNL